MSKNKKREPLVSTYVETADEAAHTPTAPAVIAGLIGGYVSARATGVRALGAVALGAAGIYAGQAWYREGGAGRAAGLTALYLGAFGASHGLAKVIGSWPSVLSVTGVASGAAWAVHDKKFALAKKAREKAARNTK